MKKTLMALTGLISGLFFLLEGFRTQHEVLALVGVLSAAFALLTAYDEIRGKIRIRINVDLRTPARKTARFFRAHGDRFKALYRIYQTAPLIVERQAQFEDRIHQLEIVEKQSLIWKRLAIESAASPQRKAVPASEIIQEKISFFPHPGGDGVSFTEFLGTLKELQLSDVERALFITDMGRSEVDGRILEEALNGEIELDFWIARRVVKGSDLLVLQSNLVREKTGRVADLLEKMSGTYARVVVVIEFEASIQVQEALLPDSQRIIRTTAFDVEKIDLI